MLLLNDQSAAVLSKDLLLKQAEAKLVEVHDQEGYVGSDVVSQVHVKGVTVVPKFVSHMNVSM